MAAFNFHRRRIRRWWYAGVTLVAAALFAVFYVAGAGAVLSGSPSKFEANDGNMIVDTTGNSDWKTVNFTHVSDLFSSQSDDSFTSGQKQDTVCPDVSGHGNPPKDDFTDVASYSETNTTTGDTYLYGATVRFAANGNASENVELKQGTSGFCQGSTTLLARTPGDKLIAIDYLNGGTNVQFNVLTWIDGTDPTNATCFVPKDPTPCWGAAVLTLSGAGAEGLASQAAIAAADNPISNADLVAGQFAEFGVNLATANVIPRGTCKAFPQTIWESRSSGSSFVSTTKDIAIENHTISNCGTVIIRKVTVPHDSTTSFGYTDNVVTAPATTTSPFSLKDGGSKTILNVLATSGSSTYTVTEDDPSGLNYALDSIDCSASSYTTGISTDKSTRTVTFSIASGQTLDCTFTNKPVHGALVIKKNSTKSGTAVKNAGATFCYSTSTGCTSANVTDTTDGTGGDSDTATGSVCVSGLTPGTYYVNEVSAPSGYGLVTTGQTNKSVSVVAGTDCSSSLPSSNVTFTDPPLADVQINFRDGGSGETSLDSAMTCTASNSTGTDAASTPPSGWSSSDTISGVQAGASVVTVTCTAKIDP